ncbi:MAG TPA: histidine kinase dimerization/phosphoacceptor domain -containing protein [Ignavibacteria bacterium]|nr:histidine kinase dimerization/phosphoacceptor domain -containing protein [Ignavibacteria bacterium]
MQNTRERDSLQNLIEVLNLKNKELRLLYETSRFFSSTLNINELYNKLFDVLRNIVDMQDMFVARFDENERKIKYIYLRSILEEDHIDVSSIPEIPLAPEGKGILSEAIRKNDTIIINDYQKRLAQSSVKYHITNEGNLSEKDMGKEYEIETAMIVPIKLNGKILGFITLMSKNKNEFGEENRPWIETMVNQAAIAKNAILFAEVNSDAREKVKLEAALEKVSKERELLSREASSRVKDNMKIISSLLQFQADYVKDPVHLEYFKVTRSRAQVLAMVQDKLYSAESLNEIDIEAFLYTLIPYLYSTFDISLNRVSTYINVKHVYLPLDKAITCSLIINELLSHSLLHSFPNKKKGNITIDMHEEKDGKYYLSVRDNGMGVISAKGRPHTFSMVLVGMYAKNLGGTFEIDRKSGTRVEIRF